MIEGLKSRYRVEECIFNTIFGKFEGHKILAIRKVAEKIEVQIRYAAQSGIFTYYLQLQYL
jgi:DNA polymerase, archaea type